VFEKVHAHAVCWQAPILVFENLHAQIIYWQLLIPWLSTYFVTPSSGIFSDLAFEIFPEDGIKLC
jgi:hypothetical protein